MRREILDIPVGEEIVTVEGDYIEEDNSDIMTQPTPSSFRSEKIEYKGVDITDLAHEINYIFPAKSGDDFTSFLNEKAVEIIEDI